MSENEIILDKLSDVGLPPEEATAWIERLDPEERKVVIEELNTVQEGGNISLLAAIIVLLYIYFVDIQRIFDPYHVGPTGRNWPKTHTKGYPEKGPLQGSVKK